MLSVFVLPQDAGWYFVLVWNEWK